MAFYMLNSSLHWLAWWRNVLFLGQGIHFCREINPFLWFNPFLVVYRKKSSISMKNCILHVQFPTVLACLVAKYMLFGSRKTFQLRNQPTFDENPVLGRI